MKRFLTFHKSYRFKFFSRLFIMQDTWQTRTIKTSSYQSYFFIQKGSERQRNCLHCQLQPFSTEETIHVGPLNQVRTSHPTCGPCPPSLPVHLKHLTVKSGHAKSSRYLIYNWELPSGNFNIPDIIAISFLWIIFLQNISVLFYIYSYLKEIPKGVSGWLSWLSVRLGLRSWSCSLWVRDPRRQALC